MVNGGMQCSELQYESIIIREEQPFCTDNSVDVFRVVRGNVRVSVVCYAGTGTAEAGVSLSFLKVGDVFPGFFYRDMDYKRWMFRIEPENREAELCRMPGLVTGLLQKRFCEKTGCPDYEASGFESALMDYYLSNYKQQIVVTNAQPLYTENNRNYYRVVRGSVVLSVVPTTGGKRKNSRNIGRISEGLVFPAVSGQDEEGTVWQFLIRPGGGSATLEVGADLVTEPLLEAFRRQYSSRSESRELPKMIRDVYRAEEKREADCIAKGQEYRNRIARKTVGLLWDAVSQSYVDPYEVPEQDSGIYAILAYACRKSHIDLVSWERVTECYDGPAGVQDIARISNFICRELVLDEQWYRSDCGPLICTLDGTTVACIPRGSGYICFDGKREQRVSKDLAGKIEPKAWSIGRALPRQKLAFKQLRQFCMKSISRTELLWILLLGLIGTGIGVFLPSLNQMVYDKYIPNGNMSMVWQMCMLMGSFMISNLFFSLVKKLMEFRVGCHVEYDLQNAVFLRIFQLPESFFREYDSADLAKRVQDIGPAANRIVSGIVGSGLSCLLSLLYLVQMFRYSSRLALVACGMLVVFLGVQFLLDRWSLNYEKIIVEEDGKAASRLYQFLSAVDKIRMAGAEERAIYEYMLPVTAKQRGSIRSNRIRSASSALREVATYLFAMVFYYIAIREKLASPDKAITMGQFAGFNSAFGSLSGAAITLMSTALAIYQMRPSFARMRPILNAALEDDGSREIVQELDGAVAFEHVTFGYSEDCGNVLSDISFTIQPGEYVAIVGPSGCGKSTALKLLLGFETPQSGRVCYDGKDIRSMDIHSLRRKLGVVLQNGRLISGSIFENITITAPQTKPAAVDRIIEAVGLKDDIEQMPMGVHTVISEDGNTISGGQLQRILIARAIANDPRILYFDEATSALDNRTQAKVVANLDRMNMTRVVIAHRLSTIRTCDRILVFDKGEIREQGTYEQLMARGPGHLFYDMAVRQIAED